MCACLGVDAIGFGQTWAESGKSDALNPGTLGGNTAEMAEFLATSTAPTPPGPRQTPIALMDVPGCLRGRGRGVAQGEYDGFGCHGVTFWQFVFEISRVLSKKLQIA